MSEITPEEYQREGALFLARRKKALVVSPAGSGKTIMAALALDFAIKARKRDRPVRIGWMCNTREQMEQGIKALTLFESIRAQGALGREVKVACAAAATDWSDRDVLVVDECHHAMAREWFMQIRRCPGAIWGITATAETGDEFRDDGLRDLFEQQVLIVGRERVKNRLVQARVVMLDRSDPNGQVMDQEIEELMRLRKRQMRGAPVTEDELFRMCSWQVVCSTGIAHNAIRNRAAVEKVQQHIVKDQVLMLVNSIEHGQALCEMIGGPVAYANSKMGKKKRKEVLDSFRAGELRCIVATSLADEGLDLPMANVMVLASGGRSRVKAEQRTGRVLRSFTGKTEGLVYDFLDSQHSVMANQARSRMQLYQSLGYRITREDGSDLPLLNNPGRH